MIPQRKQLAILLLVAMLAGFGYGPCSGKQQPKTVADILVTAENVKRDLRSRNEISAQNDYDISARLVDANRAYKRFIEDELARLAAGGTNQPDPSARQAAIKALVTSLRGLENPSTLGIKGESAQKLWRESIAGISTVISGLELLQGGS